jgi:hypothetical protein
MKTKLLLPDYIIEKVNGTWEVYDIVNATVIRTFEEKECADDYLKELQVKTLETLFEEI